MCPLGYMLTFLKPLFSLTGHEFGFYVRGGLRSRSFSQPGQNSSGRASPAASSSRMDTSSCVAERRVCSAVTLQLSVPALHVTNALALRCWDGERVGTSRASFATG